MSSSSNWRRQMQDIAREAGAILESTNGGHLRIRHPTAGWSVFTSATPGDHRALLNTRAQVRRNARRVA